jgi:tripartite-type tricarboxylate transporter receptor subunit TctC
MMSRIVFGLICAAALVAGPLPVTADPVAEFYRGKTITIVTGGGAGGPHAVYAELLKPFLEKHIPGNPTIIPQYMPGAGGLRANNYLYKVAARDGTVLGSPLQELVLAARLGVQGVQYDPAQFSFLGGAEVTRSTITVLKSAGVTTLEEARKTELIMAAGGRASQPFMYPAVANAILGTRFRIITGYPGITEMDLAVERGEAHGRAGSWGSIKGARRHWIEKDMVTHLAVIGPDREPDLPDVPLLTEFAESEADREVLELISITAVHGRAYIAPPDVPADRLAVLREAFAKALQDPELGREAQRRGLHLEPVSWQAQQQAVNRIMQANETTVQRLRKILGMN